MSARAPCTIETPRSTAPAAQRNSICDPTLRSTCRPGVPGSNQPGAETVVMSFNSQGQLRSIGSETFGQHYTTAINYDTLGRPPKPSSDPTPPTSIWNCWPPGTTTGACSANKPSSTPPSRSKTTPTPTTPPATPPASPTTEPGRAATKPNASDTTAVNASTGPSPSTPSPPARRSVQSRSLEPDRSGHTNRRARPATTAAEQPRTR